jgi:hypothetical protein
MASTYSELFAQILDRPSDYVSHNSISLIKSFLDGYAAAADRDTKDDFYFTDWIAKKFERRTAHSWESIISFIGVSEARAYELAKELWKEYNNQAEFVSDRYSVSVESGAFIALKSSELLERILDRPAMYLGYESVPRMKAFIDGYEFAKGGKSSPVRDPLYVGFQDWVASRFQVKTSHSWASIIVFMGLSESGAFTLMKELWQEYKAEIRTAADKKA